MFNKDKFSEILIKARGNRTNEDYSKDSGVSRAYISNYINANRDAPPSADIIRKLADVAQNDVTYKDLMIKASFIGNEQKYINYNEYTDNLIADAKDKLSHEEFEIFKILINKINFK